MSLEKNIVIAFDLYGTLLSTESIAKKLADHFGPEKASSIATVWRRYQLEYTWRLNSMNQYRSFSEVTRSSLSHALGDHGLELNEASVEALMQAYDSLSTFPDVDAALSVVSKNPRLTAVVFSNGTNSMVGSSVKCSPDLGPHASVFKHMVTVEEVRKFKPSPDVYLHLAEKVGKEKSREGMKEMWLISGNPFDVVGARAVGMQAAWVDRQGTGWSDGLVDGEAGTPTLMGVDLSEIVEAILKPVS